MNSESRFFGGFCFRGNKEFEARLDKMVFGEIHVHDDDTENGSMGSTCVGCCVAQCVWDNDGTRSPMLIQSKLGYLLATFYNFTFMATRWLKSVHLICSGLCSHNVFDRCLSLMICLHLTVIFGRFMCGCVFTFGFFHASEKEKFLLRCDAVTNIETSWYSQTCTFNLKIDGKILKLLFRCVLIASTTTSCVWGELKRRRLWRFTWRCSRSGKTILNSSCRFAAVESIHII